MLRIAAAFAVIMICALGADAQTPEFLCGAEATKAGFGGFQQPQRQAYIQQCLQRKRSEAAGGKAQKDADRQRYEKAQLQREQQTAKAKSREQELQHRKQKQQGTPPNPPSGPSRVKTLTQ